MFLSGTSVLKKISLLILVLGFVFLSLPMKTSAMALTEPDQASSSDSAAASTDNTNNTDSADTSTSKTTDTSTPASTSNSEATSQAAESKADQKNTTVKYILVGIGVLILVGLLIYLIKFRKSKV